MFPNFLNLHADWERVLDCDMTIAYVDKLKRFKVEADRQISKLDALDASQPV